jgi:hypothetical protein
LHGYDFDLLGLKYWEIIADHLVKPVGHKVTALSSLRADRITLLTHTASHWKIEIELPLNQYRIAGHGPLTQAPLPWI